MNPPNKYDTGVRLAGSALQKVYGFKDLIASNKQVTAPIAVRYAYTQHPNGNLLCNKDGQPVGPFSTTGYGPEPEAAK